MRVLLTGVAGQLGRDLAQTFADTDLTALTSAQLDITDQSAVAAAVQTHAPDVVLNAAAYTAVDACEQDAEPAWQVNAAGPWHLARACADQGSVLVHVSTDYVFDGEADRPYTEFDATNPRTVYGRTKDAGEQLVRGALDRHYIVRTAWLHGSGGGTFADKVLARARDTGEVAVVNDQCGSPTFTTDVASAIRTMVEQEVPFGTYHRTSTGACTWFDFAAALFEMLGEDVRLRPTTSAAFAAPAPRPRNSVLENRMAGMVGLSALPQWRDALTAFVRTHLR